MTKCRVDKVVAIQYSTPYLFTVLLLKIYFQMSAKVIVQTAVDRGWNLAKLDFWDRPPRSRTIEGVCTRVKASMRTLL